MKVAIYARVSTDGQNTDLQLRELREYVKRRGMVLYDEYIDEGFTGSKEKRPKLDALMRDARKRLFDCVLVWKFDRFARSTKHLVTVLDEFRALNISFISSTEQIDTSTPMGQVMFTIIAAMAQFERDLIKERVKAGMSAAKARGVRLGRKRKINWTKVYTLDSEGVSYAKIAKEVGCSKSQIGRLIKRRKSL